ncbi:MAG: hypothetical protein GY705_22695 [Bacteroidetes bacterium]|nr:hypothetical protein [Bacteroidota bacterium]
MFRALHIDGFCQFGNFIKINISYETKHNKFISTTDEQKQFIDCVSRFFDEKIHVFRSFLPDRHQYFIF